MAVSMTGGLNSIAFLMGATIVADLIAKACSSPQTTELNAATRATTLMKWVNVGVIEAAVLVGIAMAIEDETRMAILAGAVCEIIITYAEYLHAKRAGLRSSEPGTESW